LHKHLLSRYLTLVLAMPGVVNLWLWSIPAAPSPATTLFLLLSTSPWWHTLGDSSTIVGSGSSCQIVHQHHLTSPIVAIAS
jgi:hypothetical protein